MLLGHVDDPSMGAGPDGHVLRPVEVDVEGLLEMIDVGVDEVLHAPVRMGGVDGMLHHMCSQDVIELAQTAAEENDVSLEFRPTENLPAAEFDKEGIHRAVLNIVANAIDAVAESEDGAVVVQTGFDDRAGVMLVAVSDNGPGIPEDQRQVIFNVFESSKGSRGTGIGLPVSRKIIREHGGRVRIEGGPGEGTRFVLSWPRGNPDQADDGSSFGARTLMLDPPE